MQDQTQLYLPKLSFINKIIIITASVIFAFNAILEKVSAFSLDTILGISAEHLLHGHIYSLVTYPFFNHSILEVILNCLMLWLMGSEFESNWGRARYLKFLATVIIGGALFYLLISIIFFKNHLIYSLPLTGLGGVVAALCVAYAVIYPTRVFSFMMIIPIQAKYFCWILVALALYQGFSTPLMVGAWGQLGAIVAGFLYMVIVSNRNFKLLSQKMSQIVSVSSRKKSKAKLTIVKENDEKPPKYWQ